jgi:hypothetical protein
MEGIYQVFNLLQATEFAKSVEREDSIPESALRASANNQCNRHATPQLHLLHLSLTGRKIT